MQPNRNKARDRRTAEFSDKTPGPDPAPVGYGFGGKTWRVPQPVPAVSECLELIRAARAGDEYSQWRVEELYENT